MVKVIKRDGTKEQFDNLKIIRAVDKSSDRINITLNSGDKKLLLDIVERALDKKDVVSVNELHGYVERALDIVSPEVAKSYKDYRNYKTEIEYLLIKDIKHQIGRTMDEKDRSNSNSNSDYISTQRTEIAGIVNKELYQEMYLSVDKKQAMKEGYIYIHDLKDLLLRQFNCCLCDVKSIMSGGFNLEGYHYNEPKDIRTAVGQLADIMMIESAQHFGGLTIPEIDKTLSKYYQLEITRISQMLEDILGYFSMTTYSLAKKIAYRNLKQAIQGLEIKFNTVVSARGSYPFTTLTFGDVDNEFEADICKAILEVRMEGHGEINHKRTCIFPKLVFLYNKEKHSKGKDYDWLFDISVQCSSKCMYPDYIGEHHKREGLWVSPMGE